MDPPLGLVSGFSAASLSPQCRCIFRHHPRVRAIRRQNRAPERGSAALHGTLFRRAPGKSRALRRARGAAALSRRQALLARCSMVCRAVELVSEFLLARGIPRWLSRRIDRANGGARGAPEIPQTGAARQGSREAGSLMNVLFVDLEREWRGGQSQALLTLRGLRERGHQVELVAAINSPLAVRSAEAGIPVHGVIRLGLRAWAALAIRRLIRKKHFDLVHVNEPHALTASWLARAHKK